MAGKRHQSLWARARRIKLVDVMRFLLLALCVWAGAKEKGKLNCSARELARQDCHLISDAYDFRLLAKTIAWTDGTWHTVDPMPLAGEALEWERIGFRRIGGRPILQIWLWDKGVGESKVQSLHWYVAEAQPRKVAVLAESVVRKRHSEDMDGEGKKAKYLYDGWEPHAVRSGPDGALEWRSGGQKKTLPKPAEEK